MLLAMKVYIVKREIDFGVYDIDSVWEDAESAIARARKDIGTEVVTAEIGKIYEYEFLIFERRADSIHLRRMVDGLRSSAIFIFTTERFYDDADGKLISSKILKIEERFTCKEHWPEFEDCDDWYVTARRIQKGNCR
jgi:hypothetical protein